MSQRVYADEILWPLSPLTPQPPGSNNNAQWVYADRARSPLTDADISLRGNPWISDPPSKDSNEGIDGVENGGDGEPVCDCSSDAVVPCRLCASAFGSGH